MIGSHCTELEAFCPFLPSLPVSIKNLGRLPKWVLCSLRLQVNHRTHLCSPPKTASSVTPSALFNKDSCTTCLRACGFRFYFKCSRHLNSGALPRWDYVSWNLDYSLLWDFSQVTVWFLFCHSTLPFPICSMQCYNGPLRRREILHED